MSHSTWSRRQCCNGAFSSLNRVLHHAAYSSIRICMNANEKIVCICLGCYLLRKWFIFWSFSTIAQFDAINNHFMPFCSRELLIRCLRAAPSFSTHTHITVTVTRYAQKHTFMRHLWCCLTATPIISCWCGRCGWCGGCQRILPLSFELCFYFSNFRIKVSHSIRRTFPPSEATAWIYYMDLCINYIYWLHKSVCVCVCGCVCVSVCVCATSVSVRLGAVHDFMD